MTVQTKTFREFRAYVDQEHQHALRLLIHCIFSLSSTKVDYPNFYFLFSNSPERKERLGQKIYPGIAC